MGEVEGSPLATAKEPKTLQFSKGRAYDDIEIVTLLIPM